LRVIDLTGRRLGRLTVLARAGSDPRGRALWLCHCECGAEKAVQGSALAKGRIVSCGCWVREALRVSGRKNRRHGQSRGTPEYRAWRNMISRCTWPKLRDWRHYGGRGIRVAQEWLSSFEAFFAHIGPRPSPGLSVDRIDVNGHYEPGIVRWATASEQNRNRRR
jgi:hypothetical protein